MSNPDRIAVSTARTMQERIVQMDNCLQRSSTDLEKLLTKVDMLAVQVITLEATV